MMTISWYRLPAALSLVALVGCASPDDEISSIGVGNAGDDKADSWNGTSATDPIARGEFDEVYVDGPICRADGETLSSSPSHISYESWVHVIAPERGDLVEITPGVEDFIPEIFIEWGMQAYVRNVGETTWDPISVSLTTDGEVTGKLWLFTKLRFDGHLGKMRFFHPDFAPDGKDVEFDYIRGQDVEYAITVFPYERWGDLRGGYYYTLGITCQYADCSAPDDARFYGCRPL